MDASQATCRAQTLGVLPGVSVAKTVPGPTDYCGADKRSPCRSKEDMLSALAGMTSEELVAIRTSSLSSEYLIILSSLTNFFILWLLADEMATIHKGSRTLPDAYVHNLEAVVSDTGKLRAKGVERAPSSGEGAASTPHDFSVFNREVRLYPTCLLVT